MIIFLYGSDGFRLNRYAQELHNRYRAKYQSGLNLVTIDASQTTATDDLSNALKSISFFDEVKFIVLKQPFAQKPIATSLAVLLTEEKAIERKDVVILLSDARPVKDLKTHKELFELASRKGNTVQEFEFLQGSSLHKWIREESARLGCNLNPLAAAALLGRVGNDAWSLSQEMEKLANFKGSTVITPEDVARLVVSAQDLNIFELIDAFASRNKAQAYSLLYQELQSGRDPYYVLTMLTYQIRNLLIVQDLIAQRTPIADIAKRAGLHPFVARKTAEQSKRFTTSELKALFTSLGDMETHTKQGLINLNDHLYLLFA